MTRRLFVCSLRHLPAVAERHLPSHLLSLLGPTGSVERPESIDAARHLRVAFNDIAEPREGMILPEEAHVRQVLAFAEGCDATLLVHCWAGISRSTAAAYMIGCARFPDLGEAQIAAVLRAAAPEATPNPRLVALADDVLGRNGRMIDAIRAIGRGAEAGEGTPFELRL